MQSIQLAPKVAQRFAMFVAITGKDPNKAISDALGEWLDIIGEPLAETILIKRVQRQGNSSPSHNRADNVRNIGDFSRTSSKQAIQAA